VLREPTTRGEQDEEMRKALFRVEEHSVAAKASPLRECFEA
jgi:hypothetical protein